MRKILNVGASALIWTAAAALYLGITTIRAAIRCAAAIRSLIRELRK